MNKYTALFFNDMKNTRRDPTLFVMLMVPVLIILVTRFGLPPAAEQWPVLIDYYPLIIAFFCVITAMMPGFIVSFMLLDEKDENVLTAIRILPLAPAGFFGIRMLFMFLFGFVGSFLLLQLNGVFDVQVLKSIVISMVCASCSPMFVFLTVSFAKNKIEGATVMKVLNVMIMLPLTGFFIDSPFTYLFGIIPFYWIYEGVEVISDTTKFSLFFSIAFILASIANYIFYRFTLKRYYFK